MPLGKIGRLLGNNNPLGDTGARQLQQILYAYSRIMDIDIPTIPLEANSRLQKRFNVQIGAISSLLKITPVTVTSYSRLQDTFITLALLGRSRLEKEQKYTTTATAKLLAIYQQHMLSTTRLTALNVQITLEATIRLAKLQQHSAVSGRALLIRSSRLRELVVTQMEPNFFMKTNRDKYSISTKDVLYYLSKMKSKVIN